ncbi:MAG: hypothetical protein J0L52_02385 [Caulobacterales bacterium]|nr:hypothetical protein [Caulobacterales bacterium]
MTDGVRVTVLAGQLLRSAADFFDTVAEQNPSLSTMMRDNAEVYRQVAQAVETDPFSRLDVEDLDPPPTVADLAMRLLSDAAEFFENVFQQNPETGEDLPATAEAYRALAELVAEDPEARLPTDA